MPNESKISPARRAAFDILRRVEEGGAYASYLLATKAEELQSIDRALTHELVMGVLRRQLWLDHLITHCAGRDATRLDPPVRIALRLGLYQLRFMSRVPPSAAVNESVNLVKRARMRSAEALVNAVLRRATREPDYDPKAAISDQVERLSLETSHPVWLVQRWIENWGLDEAAAFAHANNEAAPTAFRIVNARACETEIIESLRTAGATLTPSPVTPGAWRSSGASQVVNKLRGEGRIYIQDEASQLVAQVLGVQAGEKVLDVCAAPGGKSTHIADLAGPTAIVIAGDIHSHRLLTIMAAAELQGLANIHCVAHDAQQSLPFESSKFDRVLVDAPCTGTGTLRRNPEIRWRITAADIEDLARRQLAILRNAARMVKTGGRLVYSTCSVEIEENEQVINRLTSEFADFRPINLTIDSSLLTGSNIARVWPHRTGADGFFIAAFERK